ncbi:uncharacterized protein LOC129909836 isoform X2 [Episyrphus balteatus]|uniref:uncharacterized protein LOC129909836 isoform X2 n=1 Tax=Episyrphus balteatus TaxID=286459 RepID=UPI0024858F34|nr:uncharacterized protein LOC129909836 isoform X2 [Episyrphus balteatus]
MDTKNRVLMEACVGYFNSMNLCYKQYDLEMRYLRRRFLNRLDSKIEANIRVHQLNLMNTIEMLYMNEFPKKKKGSKKEVLSEFIQYNTITGTRTRKRRSIWMKKRNADWWDSMRQSVLYNELKPKPNAVRSSVPIETKIAAALYKLATNEPYLNIGNKFGIHALSVQKSMFQFCDAVTKVLQNEYISMPEGDEITDVMQEFEDKIGLPQVLGVIEGTQISISNHAVGFSKHVARYNTTDMILQGVIDPNCLFRDVDILTKPKHFTKYYSKIKELMSEMPTREVDGIPVPAYLISRREDAVHSCLMKPYAKVNTPEQEMFNDYLSKSTSVSEQTFKKLKGRWKILQEPLKVTVKLIPKVIKTCCILHNILEMKGMQYDSDCDDEDSDAEKFVYTEPQDVEEDSSDSGEVIRDHLKNFICSQLT